MRLLRNMICYTEHPSSLGDRAGSLLDEQISLKSSDRAHGGCGSRGPCTCAFHAQPVTEFSLPSRDGSVVAGEYFDYRLGQKRPNWGVIGGIGMAHAAVAALLILFDVVPVPKAPLSTIVVSLNDLDAAPPPEAAPEPEFHFEQPDVLLAPPPDVVIQQPTPPRMVVAPMIAPPPPAAPSAVVVGPPAPPAPARPAPAPVSAGDLGSRVIEAPPPAYPMMSRRKREQGVVLLNVLLDETGRVAKVTVQSSSGHQRLDRAALDAVRRWRWAPTLVDGVPMQVRGLVEIPFILKG